MVRKKSKTPTLYDVADLAGVSPSTVSRFLNRTSQVSEDKSHKIEQAITTLGYKPHFQIQQAKSRRSMTIGVLVQHPDSPYTSSILNDMEKVLMAQGYSLVLATGHWQNKLEMNALEYLMRCSVDGLIVVTGDLSEQLIRQTAESIPVIAVGYNIEGENIRSLSLDNCLGGYIATLHLLQLGHMNIAHIKGLDFHPDSKARFKGYKKALAELNIKPNPKLVMQGDFSAETGYKKTIELIESKTHFSAIFSANDQTAYGAIKALTDRGLRVSEDVSVIGFDDLPVSQYFTPALTTLRQPIEEIGTLCAKSMLNLLSGERFEARLPPIDLIVRQSTKSIYR
ncbi:substrate-binding domain-containing protein [Vibrio parahaemolyticus]|uniref:LacI family DNA-binding transcriptional regulator n=3 Tax=Vibrio TaxID=662 RepID=UPI001A90C175|nr:substrate-binding domain-containing protein [Vibrio parahaemolyticus]MBO0190713.1 substrate-binding domain-containing protein [Vibrio parahaemolyticus]MBO0222176.1 substrate-binding domain-containing protein [Vibrio parahaemolyticus]MDF4791804.1 substrate-binding domain-containing protein [Vibrio parahaemolyticus]